jgi:DNA-directed RNA polymerase subunit RPC12/RpoP
MSEEKLVFAVGDRVEQMCVTCGEERGHIVVAVSKKGKVTRVSCPICSSRVAFKGGASRRTSSEAGPPYDRARTYRRGQTMLHPMFGHGEVTAVIEPGKIDVLFNDRMRRLIHSL